MDTQKFIKEMIKYRHTIVYFILSFGLVFLIYGFIAKKDYLSEGQIMPQMDVGGLMDLSSVLGGTMGQESKMMRVAKAAGLSLGYSSADVIGALLKSRTVMESVIMECDLLTHYQIKPNRMENALKQLKSVTRINITREDIIQIQCVASSPAYAAKIVNSYINSLDKFLREKNMSKGKNMRIFLENRLADAEVELKETADSLRTYQEEKKIILPDQEIKAAIDGYAKLNAELISKEVETEIMMNYSTYRDPYYATTKLTSEAIKKKLAEMETYGNKNIGFGAGFGISLSHTPVVIQEYYRRYLDVRIQEEIYGFLKQQYEQARIMEIKDTPAITVLDWGKPPERKHWPQASKLLIIGLLLGFVVGVVKCAGSVLLSSLRQDTRRWGLVNDARDAFTGDLKEIWRFVKRNIGIRR